MTNPISHFGQIAQKEVTPRQLAGKGESSASGAHAVGRSLAPQSDEVQLSEVALQAMREPEFDRAKVESIKQAIQQGQYPLDTRRIAESFVAIEKMIED